MQKFAVISEKRVKILPKFHKATVGDLIYFNCVSKEDVHWNFNGKCLPQNAVTGQKFEKRHRWLKIYNVQTINSGIYTCSTDQNEIITFSSAQLTVISKLYCSHKKYCFHA